jgi:hypothetical protein
MPAERTSFGALADITVTTSYRGPSLINTTKCGFTSFYSWCKKKISFFLIDP